MPPAADFDRCHDDHDLAAFGELDRVADQVDDDLRQAAAVADHSRRHVRRDLTEPARPLSRARRGAMVRSIAASAWRQVEIGGIEVDLAGFDLGEIEDVVDEREQGVGSSP